MACHRFGSVFIVALAVLNFLCIVSAETCDDSTCIGIGEPDRGDCGVDPHDDEAFAIAIYLCPCAIGEINAVTVTYTGLNNIGKGFT